MPSISELGTFIKQKPETVNMKTQTCDGQILINQTPLTVLDSDSGPDETDSIYHTGTTISAHNRHPSTDKSLQHVPSLFEGMTTTTVL